MTMLLPHQGRLVEAIRACLDEVAASGNSRGILLVGDSGTGKSHAFDAVEALFSGSAKTDGVQRLTPVVRVDLRTATTPTAVMRAMLGKLGRPISKDTVKLDTLETMLHDALTTHRSVIVLLEELHNALTKESKRFAGKTGELMKSLWNRLPPESVGAPRLANGPEGHQKLVIVASGLPVLREVFTKDRELASRYSSIIEARYLTLATPESIRLVRQVVNEFRKRFSLAEVVDPNDNEMIARLYLATGMHLRYLENLFSRAMRLHKRSPELGPMQLMREAYVSALSVVHALHNPFDVDTERLGQMVANESKGKPRSKGAVPA